ncbi:MAG TPA: hypothetical protein VK802_01965 [Streptosporangiaceae bacterium]|nr:hypothetical protein [Streptosporangiaceae bacterium]
MDTELATHLRDEIRQAAQRQAGAIQPLRAEDIADAVAYTWSPGTAGLPSTRC